MSDATLTEREQRAYHLGAALLDLAEERPIAARASLAWDLSQDIERTHPDRGQRDGLFVPWQIRAGLDTATATKGQEAVFAQPESFIDALRAEAQTLAAGATILTGLVGTASWPRISTTVPGVTAVAQNPLADVADSNLLLNQLTLSPKTLQASTSYSYQLLRQSLVAVGIDQVVQTDLARQTAAQVDVFAINGSGASNQPTGILGTAGIGSVALGVNGLPAVWANLVDLEFQLASNNVPTGPDHTDDLAFLTTPVQRQSLRKKDRGGATTGWFVVSDISSSLGIKMYTSTSVPSTLTKGTSVGICHAIILGRFSELFVGFWGAGYQIVTDPFRLKKQGMVELTSFVNYDIGLRHPASFAAIKDALP